MSTLALHHEKIVYLSTNIKKNFGGSTFDFDFNTNQFVRLRNTEKKPKVEIIERPAPTVKEKPFELPDWFKPSYQLPELEESEADDNQAKEKKPHKLNKNKVRAKLTAYFNLKHSKKFLAFYSISFPCHLPDDIAYKIFNIALTRCRKKLHLNSYLWVAERQSKNETNQTIHFHMITNNYMYVRYVNHFIKSALITEQKRGLECLQNLPYSLDNYNGVDVLRIENNQKRFAQYITKYVSKNNVEFYRACWNCSQSISALFTHEYFDGIKDREYIQDIRNSIKKYVTEVLDFEYCTVEKVHVKQKYGNYPYIKCSSIDHLNAYNDVLYNRMLAIMK